MAAMAVKGRRTTSLGVQWDGLLLPHWCGHCKCLASDFEKAATQLLGSATLITAVVAENFDILNDASKDALIVFYAPWCSHCKNLEPTYRQLGEMLTSDPHIVIAKVDAPANDGPSDYDVRGFPTVLLEENNLRGIGQGGREVSDFLNYSKKESTSPLVATGEDKRTEKEL